MATLDLAETTVKIHTLLKELEEPADRQKVISAALTLLGDVFIAAAPGRPTAGASMGAAAPAMAGATLDAIQFFEQKDPRNKIEELAVAARFRELTENAESHTKDQLGSVIKSARRNFDVRNFARDMGNAKTAKMFNLGSENALSYAGQKYVDALPNRELAAAARKPAKRVKKIDNDEAEAEN
jgi:hypothetical protein